MRVYLMRFDSRDAVNHAFGLLLDASAVESSLVGPPPLQLCFMAKWSDAESLIERIYQRGGLTWCTSHEVKVPAKVPAQLPAQIPARDGATVQGAAESPADPPHELR